MAISFENTLPNRPNDGSNHIESTIADIASCLGTVPRQSNALKAVTVLDRSVLSALRSWLLDQESMLRAQTLKCIRRFMKSTDVHHFYAMHIDFLVIRCLEREKCLLERMQALKLVRRIVALTHDISQTLLYSLIALADYAKDDFRKVSLETLRELLLVRPELVVAAGGIRVIVDAILDPACRDVAALLISTLINLIDQPMTRSLCCFDLELCRVLSIYTDLSIPDSSEKEARRAAAHTCLSIFLKSFAGIVLLSNTELGLSSLVSILSLPTTIKGVSWSKEAIFDLFFDILQPIKSSEPALYEIANNHPHNIFHSYGAILLLALIQCSLPEQLMQLAVAKDGEFAALATKLLHEILDLVAAIMPNERAVIMHAMPSIVNSASSLKFDNDVSRVEALHMMSALKQQYAGHDSALQEKPLYFRSDSVSASCSGANNVVKPHLPFRRGRTASFSFMFSSDDGNFRNSAMLNVSVERHLILSQAHGIRLVNLCFESDCRSDPHEYAGRSSAEVARAQFMRQLRFSLDSSMEEFEFFALMKQSNVLATKDFTEWDLTAIARIVQGPLHHPSHLNTALKSKFIKRILSVNRPDKAIISQLPWRSSFVAQHGRICCDILRLLLTSPECVGYVWLNVFCEQILGAILVELNINPKHVRKGKVIIPSASDSPVTNRSPDLKVSPDSKSSPLDSGIIVQAASNTVKGSSKALKCLSRLDITYKLCRNYCMYIAIIMSTAHGNKLCDELHLFDVLLSCKDPTKEYLWRVMFMYLDFGEYRNRLLVEHWLHSGSSCLRKSIYSAAATMLERNPANYNWLISFIACNHAAENDAQCRWMIVDLLTRAVVDRECLRAIVEKNIDWHSLEIFPPLLLHRLLSSSEGFDLLRSNGILDKTVHDWQANKFNAKYVNCLHSVLAQKLGVARGFEIFSNSSGTATLDNLATTANQYAHVETECESDRWHCPVLNNGLDNYLVERLHTLPWVVDLRAEYPTGKRVYIQTDTFLCMLPSGISPHNFQADPWRSSRVHGHSEKTSLVQNSVLVSEPPKTDSSEGEMQLFVVAVLLDSEGRARPMRFDPSATFRARLSVGSMLTGIEPPASRVGRAQSNASQKSNLLSLPMPSAERATSMPQHMSSDKIFLSGLHPNLPFDEASTSSAFDGMNNEQVCRPLTRDVLSPDRPYCCTTNALPSKDQAFWVFEHMRSNATESLKLPVIRHTSSPTDDMPYVLQSVWFKLPQPGSRPSCVCLHQHLFGSIAQTESGCKYLRDAGHLDTLQTWMNANNSPDVLAAMWAISHIGRTATGLMMLKMDNYIQWLASQATDNLTLSLRGTASYLLGMIGQTREGTILLASLGWSVSTRNVNVALPAKGSPQETSIFSFPVAPAVEHKLFAYGAHNPNAGLAGDDTITKIAHLHLHPTESTVLSDHDALCQLLWQMANLCNHVTQKASFQSLKELSVTHPHVFANSIVLQHLIRLLHTYTYRLPVRRYLLHDMFALFGNIDQILSSLSTATNYQSLPRLSEIAEVKPTNADAYNRHLPRRSPSLMRYFQ